MRLCLFVQASCLLPVRLRLFLFKSVMSLWRESERTRERNNPEQQQTLCQPSAISSFCVRHVKMQISFCTSACIVCSQACVCTCMCTLFLWLFCIQCMCLCWLAGLISPNQRVKPLSFSKVSHPECGWYLVNMVQAHAQTCTHTHAHEQECSLTVFF